MTIFLLLASLAATPVQFKEYRAKVRYCYDGDTCYFDIHTGLGHVAKNQKVRFCDINTPEMNRVAEREKATPARDFTRNVVHNATTLWLKVPQKNKCDPVRDDKGCDQKDSFGRWLAYVIADDVNLSKKLFDTGHAVLFRKTCGAEISP